MMERAGDFLRKCHPDLLVSKQRLGQAESIQMVRMKRETRCQSLGYASRPFVLCGLPVKRPSRHPNPRAPKWQIPAAGHRASPLRPALGPGPTRADLPRDFGDPAAIRHGQVPIRR